jgi:C-terminal processing protease CtpA/Prc
MFLALTLLGQQPAVNRSELEKLLAFENKPDGNAPGGWYSNPPGTVLVDTAIHHGGEQAARFERDDNSPGRLSVLTSRLPWDFTGQTLELRGFLRTEEVSGYIGLWLREDGDSGTLALENMSSQQVKGTHDWQEYSITLPVHADMRALVFGVLLSGTGKAWADDLQLLVDGKAIFDAPRVKTVFDTDREFDAGSGIALNELSPVQIRNLATLGKVWGFLKYHHPLVTAGQRHWDYDLFRVLPGVLAAKDGSTASAAILKWIAALESNMETTPCNPCAKPNEQDIYSRPKLDWIGSQPLLGADLSQSLRRAYENRPASKKQFYVSKVARVGNPVFDHEPDYKAVKLPDSGFQLLALYRFWNIIEYWYPNRDITGEDWDHILIEFIPRITLAKTSEAYQRELMLLITKIHDTHANLWSSIKVRPPAGTCRLPVRMRFIEGRPVVSGYASESAKASGLKLGDVVTDMDGTPVSKLVEGWLPYYAASNDPTRFRDLAANMTCGECGKTTLRVRRESESLEIVADRVTVPPASITHDLPGEAFQMLPDDIAYLKLSSVKSAEAAHYVEAASKAKGLIIDIRNYPAEFVVFTLGTLFVEQPTQFVRFTEGDLSNPGTFYWDPSLSLEPAKPHFAGKVMILVDEVSQSNAEYTAMAFRAAPTAKVIGSTTAGADGNVSDVPLPGGFSSRISGIGVFYPNKRPTQRIGIIPDIEVRPTIAGIRAGKDEVLEEAKRQILNP